jgi:hypothetical protein
MEAMNWRKALASMFGAILLFALAPGARADGGSGPEAMSMGNMCMVMFGYDMIHITAYLPGKSRSEYCEEIPATGKVILVFDIENTKFRDLPLEVRIIRDPVTAVPSGPELDAITELYLPPTKYKKGTFSFEHDFKKEGHYIGLVTITKENGEKETQQYKFSVGETLWLYVPFILGGVFIGMCVWAYWRHSHPKSKKVVVAET